MSNYLIEQVIFDISTVSQYQDVIFDKCHQKFYSEIKGIIYGSFRRTEGHIDMPHHIDSIIVDLGSMSLKEFDEEVGDIFRRQLEKRLMAYGSLTHADKHNNAVVPTYKIMDKSADSSVLQQVETYLITGYWPHPERWKDRQTREQSVLEHVRQAPDVWYPFLMQAALYQSSRRRLLALHVMGQLPFTDGQFPQEEQRLFLIALRFFQRHAHLIPALMAGGVVPVEQTYRQARVQLSLLQDTTPPVLDISQSEIEIQLKKLFSSPIPAELRPWTDALLRQPELSRWLKSTLGHLPETASRKTVQETKESATTSDFCPGMTDFLLVSDAGLVLLWPLLPDLFQQLGLLDEKGFVDEEAQWLAVSCLNNIFAGDNTEQEQHTGLKKLLCGLSPDAALSKVQVSQEQHEIACQWLHTFGERTERQTGLSITDLLALFLHREGKITYSEKGWMLDIHSQPYDSLLAVWLWPMHFAVLPWLKLPLWINWPDVAQTIEGVTS